MWENFKSKNIKWGLNWIISKPGVDKSLSSNTFKMAHGNILKDSNKTYQNYTIIQIILVQIIQFAANPCTFLGASETL